ncbi:MAG: YhgE/Pip domain-containing protein [Romboutsia sp.]
MKKIFKIYKDDLKDIIKNPVLLIVVIGLAILPSLYAWFNIKASWDPYGSTKNISVAIVNKDKGSKVFDKEVNVGEELINNLKENDSLGWHFVDEKKAIEGVESGKYYASIKIPENFSSDLTSLVADDVKKGKLTYTVNEKINAIAPKITDKGASTIQLEVNETVVKTVSKIIFEVFNTVGIELENQLPKLTKVESSLVEIQNKFKDIDKTIDLADEATLKVADIIKDVQKDLPAIESTLQNAKNLSGDVKIFVEDTKKSINKIGPIIKTDLKIISDISSVASDSISNIIDTINKGGEIAPEVINNLQQKLSSLSSSIDTLTDFLNKLDKFAPGGQLKGVIEQLQGINYKLESTIGVLDIVKDQIANGQKPSLDKLNSLLEVTNNISNITSNIYNNFDSKITQPINNIFEGTLSVSNNIIEVLNNAEEKLPAVEDILNTTLAFSGSANDNVKFIKEKVPKAKNIVDELVSAMSKINNSSDVNDLIDLLKNDIFSQSDFLKQPVELVTEKLYTIENYGSAMTPFYTVLSLWVGILLLVSIVTTEVQGDYKPYEKYFGRALTFTSITVVQALIVSLGDIYLLGVQVVNPELFVAISVFTSVVFTFIVYSLVSVFGNVGKAISIIMLVIQVAASGGTFPIEVTPQFFQNVHPLLPFTHAINALRETVGGIYQPNLDTAMRALTAFLIGFMLLNVTIKGSINKHTSKLKQKFNNSHLIGH